MDYFVQLTNGDLISFYYNKGKIYYKTYNGIKFSNENILLEDVLDNFTVCISHDDSIYLFCQNRSGDVLLTTKSKDEITTRMILKNTSNTVVKVKFHALITNNKLTLLYNSESHIMLQQLDSHGKWLPALSIDQYKSLPNTIYTMQNTSYEHSLVFYLTKENHLAYREVNLDQFGSINIFHTTSSTIVDTSFLVTKNDVHMVFIVRNMFSNQILYRKKDSHNFSNVKLLSESPNISNCMIFCVENKLYVTFVIKGNLYISFSEDNGNTFSRVSKYKDRFATNLKKSYYISAQYNTSYILHEIYVDTKDPCNIALIPELYPNFLKNLSSQHVTVATYDNPTNVMNTETNNSDQNINTSDSFNRLQAEYNRALQQNEEKDKQLLYYQDLLKQNVEKINDIDIKWQDKYVNIISENADLKEKLNKLESTLRSPKQNDGTDHDNTTKVDSTHDETILKDNTNTLQSVNDNTDSDNNDTDNTD